MVYDLVIFLALGPAFPLVVFSAPVMLAVPAIVLAGPVFRPLSVHLP